MHLRTTKEEESRRAKSTQLLKGAPLSLMNHSIVRLVQQKLAPPKENIVLQVAKLLRNLYNVKVRIAKLNLFIYYVFNVIFVIVWFLLSF